MAAAVAGAGFAWWRSGHGAGEAATQPVAESLWQASFVTPSGATLAMQSLRGKPLLVNFWATWCPPCVEELPLIDAFSRTTVDTWHVVGLAIDQPTAVRAFLGRIPVSFPIGFAGLEGTELVKSLGNTEGGLPFSIALAGNGSLLGRKMGRLTAGDLSLWTRLAATRT